LLNKWFLAGKLEKSAVLKALCSGFEETTEPAICLSTGIYCWSLPNCGHFGIHSNSSE